MDLEKKQKKKETNKQIKFTFFITDVLDDATGTEVDFIAPPNKEGRLLCRTEIMVRVGGLFVRFR